MLSAKQQQQTSSTTFLGGEELNKWLKTHLINESISITQQQEQKYCTILPFKTIEVTHSAQHLSSNLELTA